MYASWNIGGGHSCYLSNVFLQVAAPEIAMIKVAVPNMAQAVMDKAIQVCLLYISNGFHVIF